MSEREDMASLKRLPDDSGFPDPFDGMRTPREKAAATRRKNAGREPRSWAKPYQRPDGAVVVVTIPRRILEEALGEAYDPKVPYLVRRTSYQDRRAVVVEFRKADRVPEGARA